MIAADAARGAVQALWVRPGDGGCFAEREGGAGRWRRRRPSWSRGECQGARSRKGRRKVNAACSQRAAGHTLSKECALSLGSAGKGLCCGGVTLESGPPKRGVLRRGPLPAAGWVCIDRLAARHSFSDLDRLIGCLCAWRPALRWPAVGAASSRPLRLFGHVVDAAAAVLRCSCAKQSAFRCCQLAATVLHCAQAFAGWGALGVLWAARDSWHLTSPLLCILQLVAAGLGAG